MPSLADPLMPAALEMHAHAKGAAGDALGTVVEASGSM
jgi:hypothetical protein